jgi:DnaJ-class molecular chaperone
MHGFEEDVMAKSYYAILGITSDASSSEIRSAYRRLAKAFHPDHYQGDPRNFREIQEAYGVLRDPYQRGRYEEKKRRAVAASRNGRITPLQPEPLIPEEKPRSFDLGEISPISSFQTFTPSFDEIFDWLWNNFTSLDWPKSGRLENLTLEVPLNAEQMLQGGNARIMIPSRAVCPTCRGAGAVGIYECYRCAGEGAISGNVPISLSFPPGIKEDHAVVIPLDRFGIKNLRLTVLFRPTGEANF